MIKEAYSTQSGILRTIAGLVVAGVIGILALLYIRPEADNSIIINTILGLITPITLGLMAKLVTEAKVAAQRSEEQAVETHNVVNSRIDEFKLQIQAIAQQEISRQLVAVREAGMQAGREEQVALSARRIGEAAIALEKVKTEDAKLAATILTKAATEAAVVLDTAKAVVEEKK